MLVLVFDVMFCMGAAVERMCLRPLRPRILFRPSSDAAITPPESKDGGVARSGKVVIALGVPAGRLYPGLMVKPADGSLGGSLRFACDRLLGEKRSERGQKLRDSAAFIIPKAGQRCQADLGHSLASSNLPTPNIACAKAPASTCCLRHGSDVLAMTGEVE